MSSQQNGAPSTRAAKRLSNAQEKRLMNYVEERFLEITRGYKKRNHPSTTLPTLSSYLAATRSLLGVILQIPPIGPQAPLRTMLLLRFSGECLTSITGYSPSADVLPELIQWLEDLDRGWQAVLQIQIWDPNENTGVDVEVPAEEADNPVYATKPVSQTDRTRLRSILVQGKGLIEDWLDLLGGDLDLEQDDVDDVEGAEERFGLRQRFEEVFEGVLGLIG